MTLTEIQEYITESGLDIKSNKRELVYQKFCIAKYLREEKRLKYRVIASMLGYGTPTTIGHDSIIYGIKQANNLKNDKLYKRLNARFLTLVNHGTDIKGLNLKEEILKAQSLIELHQIQGYIKKGIL